MTTLHNLIHALNDGINNAIHASEIEDNLHMDYGHTQEPTRDLIRDAVVNHNLPIGSTRDGFFFINTEEELEQVVEGLQRRIDGIQNRIDGLRTGWAKRQASRIHSGNWPK